MKKKLIVVLTLLLMVFGLAGMAYAKEENPERRLWQGIILSIEDNRINLATRASEVVVIVKEDTRFRVPGVPNGSLDDLAPDDRIAVAGRLDQDGAIQARLIVRIPRGTDVGLLRGELTAIGDGWLEITRPDGTPVQVLILENTRFLMPGIKGGSLEDLEPGDSVYAAGTWTDSQELKARLIGLVGEDVCDIVRGKVTVIGAPNIAILTHQGSETVITDSETQFRVPGIENATLDDVLIDDVIVAGGAFDSGGLKALVVKVVSDRDYRVVRRGEVKAREGTSLTIDTAVGSLVVLTDEQTRIRIAGVEQATLDDINIGDRVAVIGFLDVDGYTLRVRAIRVLGG